MSEQGARELLAAEYEAEGSVPDLNVAASLRSGKMNICAPAIRAITAAKEQGRREAIAELISLKPLPIEQFLAAPERERSLQAIGDVIAYWIKWVATEGLKHEEYTLNPDTHIMFGYEGAPPHWPSVGQLTRWLAVLRASSDHAPTKPQEPLSAPDATQA